MKIIKFLLPVLILFLLGCSILSQGTSPENNNEEEDIEEEIEDTATFTETISPTTTNTPTNTPTLTPTPFPDPEITMYTNPNQIKAMVFDSEGYLWTAGIGGVVRWDLETEQYQTYNYNDGMPTYGATNVVADTNGTIWIHWLDDTVSRFSNGKWEHKQFSDFPEINVLEIFVDSNNELWVTSSEGIHQYNNGNWIFTNFENNGENLPVLEIYEDNTSGIWIRTETGVGLYKEGQWQYFDNFPTYDDELEFKFSAPTIFIVRDNSIWVETLDGLKSYDGESWEVHSYPNYNSSTYDGYPDMNDMLLDLNNKLWFATSSQGIWKLDQNSWSYHQRTSHNFQSHIIDNLYMKSNGQLWGVTNREIIYWNGNTWNAIEGLPELQIQSFNTMMDKNGNIWMLTWKDGLIKINTAGAPYVSWELRCSKGLGLPAMEMDIEDFDRCSEEVWFTTWAESPNGNLYFGTDGRGILNPLTTGWEIISTTGDLPLSDVDEMTVDQNGNVWVGGDYQVASFDGNSWFSHNQYGLVFKERVYSMETAPDGSVWLGTLKGVLKWQNGEWSQWIPKNSSDNYYKLYPYAITFFEDQVWVGDSFGAHQLLTPLSDEAEWSNIDPEGNLEDSDVNLMSIGLDGTLWIGNNSYTTENNGIVSYSNGQWTNYTDIISDPNVIQTAPDGSIWVGTKRSGLFIFDGNEWKNLTIEDGIPEGPINDIEFDNNNVAWLGLSAGGGLVRIENDNIEVFNQANGKLPIYAVSFLDIAPDNSIWLGMYYGLLHFQIP